MKISKFYLNYARYFHGYDLQLQICKITTVTQYAWAAYGPTCDHSNKKLLSSRPVASIEATHGDSCLGRTFPLLLKT